MKIICLNAPPRAGKDTVTSYLAQKYGYKKYAFADYLKEFVNKAYGLTNFDDNCKSFIYSNLGDKTYRELLVHFGKSLKELYGEDYFVNKVIDSIKQENTSQNIVISDLGFPLELYALYKHFGKECLRIAYIEKAGLNYEGDSRGFVDYTIYDDDFNEIYIEWDQIYNNGTLEVLYSNVDRFIKLYCED